MGAQNSKENTSIVSSGAGTIPTAPSVVPQRIVQKFLLVWVDANIDESNKDCQNTLTQLRSVLSNVKMIKTPDQCIQFLRGAGNEKAFVVTLGSFGERLVPDIHALPELDTIYIFCGNTSHHESWADKWSKIKGVHADINLIRAALQEAAKQCDQNSIKVLANYCRPFYRDKKKDLTIIDDFEYNYRPKSPIWRYTCECVIYNMLNRALRTLDGDTIVNMGFFIRDLHQ